MNTTSLGTVKIVNPETNGSVRAWEHKRKQNIAKRFPVLNAAPAALHRVYLIETLGFDIDNAVVDREFRQSFDRAFVADMDALANLIDVVKFEQPDGTENSPTIWGGEVYYPPSASDSYIPF